MRSICNKRAHTVQQYSATVWQRAIAEDRKVLAFAPQLEFASFVLGDYCIGLGRLGFFNFGSVFNLKYSVSVFFGFGICTPP